MMKFYGALIILLSLTYSCQSAKKGNYPFYSKLNYLESKGGVQIPNTKYKGIEFTVGIDEKKVKCYYYFHSYDKRDSTYYHVLLFDSLGKLQDVDFLSLHKRKAKYISLDTLNNSCVYKVKGKEILQTTSGKKYIVHESLAYGNHPVHLLNRKSYLDISIPDSISKKPFSIYEDVGRGGYCNYEVIEYGQIKNDGSLSYTTYKSENNTLSKVGTFEIKIKSAPKSYKRIYLIDQWEIFIDDTLYEIEY